MATSAIMTAIIVVGQLVTSVLAAYAFAFLTFPFKRTLFVLCLATLMIPLEVTFITNLDTITSLHWFNTYAGLSIPFLATGFGIFLLRQAFLQIPRDLQEAAQLDGYGHMRFMTRVAVPLARPPSPRWPSSRSSAPGTSTCGRWCRPAARRRSTRCRSA